MYSAIFSVVFFFEKSYVCLPHLLKVIAFCYLALYDPLNITFHLSFLGKG